MRVTEMFFDRAAVMSHVDAVNRQALSKAGGMTRRVARQSIKFRKNREIVSKPGSPPFAHRKGLGIKTVLYGYDSSRHSVVVGPVRLGGTKDPNAPRTLEEGGMARIKVRRVKRGGAESSRKRGAPKRQRSAAERARIKAYYSQYQDEVKTKTVAIRPRPFMGPALSTVRSDLPQLWEQ